MKQIGSHVKVDHPGYPGVYVVMSNGPKNAKLQPLEGGRGLRAPHHMLLDADGSEPRPEAKPYQHFTLGQFVTLTDPRWPGVYVVIADKGEKVNVAKAGGDDNRYVRALRDHLRPVDITMALADA